MDLFSGLTSFGQYINANASPQEDNKIKRKVMINPTKNIFNNNVLSSNDKYIHKRAAAKMKLSRNHEKTGVIPKQFNKRRLFKNKKKLNFELFGNTRNTVDSDSVFSDDNTYDASCDMRSCSSNASRVSGQNFNRNMFVDKCDKFLDNRNHERKFVQKVQDDNNFLSQFEPLKYDNSGLPSSSNAVPSGSGSETMINRMEAERDLALKGGFSNFGEDNDMTYGVVDDAHFTHNNMKPNFKSRGLNNRRSEQAATVHQRKMESFSGSLNKDRPDWQHKKEQQPLFNPTTRISNIFGSPVFTDYLEGRYNPGKERRNEKPFQEEKVAPGLGLGAHENPKFTAGGGDLYRVYRPNVDQLRTANRPKLSYGRPVIPGQKGFRGKVLGRQVKNTRGVRFREYEPGYYKPTYTGQVHAPKMIGEVDPMRLGGANRSKEEKYIGPATHNVDKVTSTELRDGPGHKYREPFKRTYNQAEARGFHLVEGLKGHAGNYDAYVQDPTMREIHAETDRVGNGAIGDQQRTQYFDPKDVRDVNMRNVHASPDRTGAAMTGDKQKEHFYNPGDVPQANMRNVHPSPDRSGKAMVGDKHGAHFYNDKDIPQANMRNVHPSPDRSGKAMVGDKHGAHFYNDKDIPQANMRNIHPSPDRSGVAMTGDRKGAHFYNDKDIPQANMRNVHPSPDRSGAAMTGDRKGAHFYNDKDIPQANMRNVHPSPDRSGAAMTGDRKGAHFYNDKDVPQANMRNVHPSPDRSGAAMTGDRKGAHFYNDKDVPQNTMREIHSENDRAGRATTGSRQNTHYYNPNDVPQNTMREIHSETDRTGKAATGDKHGAHYYNPGDVPDVTVREETGYTNWKGPWREYVDRQRSRAAAHNAKVNITKEVVAKGRAPTNIKHNVGPTTGFTSYRMRDPEQSDYINHPGLLNQTPDKMPFKMENVKNPTWWFNNRFTTYPDENLKKNPYINNIVHKAVIEHL